MSVGEGGPAGAGVADDGNATEGESHAIGVLADVTDPGGDVDAKVCFPRMKTEDHPISAAHLDPASIADPNAPGAQIEHGTRSANAVFSCAARDLGVDPSMHPALVGGAVGGSLDAELCRDDLELALLRRTTLRAEREIEVAQDQRKKLALDGVHEAYVPIVFAGGGSAYGPPPW